jgi:hypothetical protein
VLLTYGAKTVVSCELITNGKLVTTILLVIVLFMLIEFPIFFRFDDKLSCIAPAVFMRHSKAILKREAI